MRENPRVEKDQRKKIINDNSFLNSLNFSDGLTLGIIIGLLFSLMIYI